MKLNSLLQLSDPHVTAKGELAYGRVNTYAMFAAAIRAVAELANKPDAILITGDLVYSGVKTEYEALAELLSPISIPVYLMPGNHDDRSVLREVFLRHDYLSPSCDGPIQYEITLPGRRVLCLDTSVPGKSHGELCTDRLQWLSDRLSTNDGTPVLIAMHHPPFETCIAYMDNIGLLKGRDELSEILQKQTNIDKIIAGHLHRFIVGGIGKCTAVTAPSTAHQIRLDVDPKSPGMFIMEPPGYLLHLWGETQETITHNVTINKSEGPYLFRP